MVVLFWNGGSSIVFHKLKLLDLDLRTIDLIPIKIKEPKTAYYGSDRLWCTTL
jgi:hypothetical protein